MKAAEECYPCLGRLVRQAAELATSDAGLRAKAIEEGLALLARAFSTENTSIAVAVPLHRLVRAVTGNVDPYLPMKEAEVVMARGLCGEQRWGEDGDLRSHLSFAVLGNNIDFFKPLESIKRDLDTPVRFSIDQVGEFEERLSHAENVLYLADNAGEVFFDLPLLRQLRRQVRVTYVVKESPVQNDITRADLDRFGLASEVGSMMTTGTDTPGVDIEMASDEFRREFERCDLALAKGMGYWETLSELPARGKVFHLLKAKCRPVAESIGVGLDDYVTLLR
jgi:uncharacterized protein with ATP-grasp and redox domains